MEKGITAAHREIVIVRRVGVFGEAHVVLAWLCEHDAERAAGVEGSALGAGDEAEEGREGAGEGEAEAALLAAAAMRAKIAEMMGDLDAG